MAGDAIAAVYEALEAVERRFGGLLSLDTCRRTDLPAQRGVYFFFEPGEVRREGRAPGRVVRVGTHGLRAGSASTLWSRLRQHAGNTRGGGNHRGSIFRHHVGGALMRAGLIAEVAGWRDATAAPQQRLAEQEAERAVSQVIRRMRFLCLPIEDVAGPESERGYIERNAIALLTSEAALERDPPSRAWLGRHALAPEIRGSGLWNVRHVGEAMDPGFIPRLHSLLARRR